MCSTIANDNVALGIRNHDVDHAPVGTRRSELDGDEQLERQKQLELF